MQRSCLTNARQIKQLTSHLDVTSSRNTYLHATSSDGISMAFKLPSDVRTLTPDARAPRTEIKMSNLCFHPKSFKRTEIYEH